MNCIEEIQIHKFLSDVRKGKKKISQDSVNVMAEEIKASVLKQLTEYTPKKFSLRMSNLGKPYCQLWFEKNDPGGAVAPPETFVIRMLFGDVIESIFKLILKEAGVKYKEGELTKLKLKNGEKINGTPDITINNRVDDIKSASSWSYKNKFMDFFSVEKEDSFGYIEQLVGYSEALNVDVGGWWVIDKSSGDFKYVEVGKNVDKNIVLKNIEDKVDKLKENKFKRSFKDKPETFRKVFTGNRILSRECSWCNYRFKCWPGLKERTSIPSKAKEPPIVSYTYIQQDQPTYDG